MEETQINVVLLQKVNFGQQFGIFLFIKSSPIRCYNLLLSSEKKKQTNKQNHGMKTIGGCKMNEVWMDTVGIRTYVCMDKKNLQCLP